MEDKNYEEEVVEEETTEETTPEEDTEETTEEETEDDTSEEESEESVDWKERAIKAEKAIEKAKKKKKNSVEVSDPDRIQRLELKAEGIKESEDQEYILRIAKAENVEVETILENREEYDYVFDKLARNKRQRQSAQATPRGNNRASTQGDEIAALARKYQKDGSLPEDMSKVSKVLDYLKNN